MKNVIATVDTATSSSYVVFDSTWVYQYDRFNDRYCYVPANPHTAGITRSDLLRDPWFSPAGFSRGQYLGITKLAFNPRKHLEMTYIVQELTQWLLSQDKVQFSSVTKLD